jgi:hypothetical protein
VDAVEGEKHRIEESQAAPGRHVHPTAGGVRALRELAREQEASQVLLQPRLTVQEEQVKSSSLLRCAE